MAGPSCVAALLCATVALAQPAEDLLARVDRLRHPWPAFSVEAQITSDRAEQRWKIWARENGDARIEGLSGKEQGRTVLLLGEDMWLLLPRARRPVRVTPQQRMLGPAAGGDLARTRFAQDYEVKDRAEDSVDGEPCWRLDLAARKPGASYRTARLFVAKASGEPRHAHFYLASGKLARTTRFKRPVEIRGIQVIPGMRVEEPKGAAATLSFSAWAPAPADPERFRLPPSDRPSGEK